MQSAPRSGCPINAAVEVPGDSWAILVLRDGGPDLVAGVMDELRELHLGSC